MTASGTASFSLSSPGVPGHRLRGTHYWRGRAQVPQLAGKPVLLQGPHPVRPVRGRQGPAVQGLCPGGRGIYGRGGPPVRRGQRGGHPGHGPDPGQVRLLKSLADKVVLVYDGDTAGARAMKRAFPLFAQENLAVRALPLPAGLDPDSYAQAHGVEIFRAGLGHGPTLVRLPVGRPDCHPWPGYRGPGGRPVGTAALRPGPVRPGGTGLVAQGHQRAAGGGRHA